MRIVKNKGFTLSEVLVVLLIIGVVAAMTIPTLINELQYMEYKQAWKKEYAAINNAFKLILAENGGTLKYACPLVSWVDDSIAIRQLFLDHLNVQKSCNNSTTGECWHTSPLPKNLNGTDQLLNGSSYPSSILNDGALLKFHAGRSDCSFSGLVYGYSFQNQCINIAVDVNGFKKPNVIGKDIFQVSVFADKITPFGIVSDCKLFPPSDFGFGCATKYLFD